MIGLLENIDRKILYLINDYLSNPIFVLIRNRILTILSTNKKFLNKYLGKIYIKK